MADAPLLATYPVRTAPGYWLAAAMLLALAGLGGTAMAFVMVTTGAAGNGVFLVVAGVAALAPIGYWLGSGAYRIGRGGAGEIRFYADRLEVPPAGGGGPLVFPRAELTASSTPMRMRYRVAGMTAASIRRGNLVRLAAGSVHRTLSTTTLRHPAYFLEDLKLYLDDAPPIGPETWAEVTAAERGR